MNILHPTPGDLWDRRLILDLKIEHGGGRHFLDERDEIMLTLGRHSSGTSPQIPGLADLITIHGKLWEANEAFAGLDADRTGRVTIDPDLGLKVYRLNLARYRCIDAINRAYGVTPVQEKL